MKKWETPEVSNLAAKETASETKWKCLLCDDVYGTDKSTVKKHVKDFHCVSPDQGVNYDKDCIGYECSLS